MFIISHRIPKSMKLHNFLVALLLLFPAFTFAQSQGCLYNGTIYPTRNGTIIVGAYGACPASTYVYSGAISSPTVASSAQCSGAGSTTVVLGSQYTGPNQTKCVIFFSPSTYVCSDVYNYVACPLDTFTYLLLSVMGFKGFLLLRRRKPLT